MGEDLGFGALRFRIEGLGFSVQRYLERPKCLIITYFPNYQSTILQVHTKVRYLIPRTLNPKP